MAKYLTINGRGIINSLGGVILNLNGYRYTIGNSLYYVDDQKKSIYDRKQSKNSNPFEKPPTKSWGWKMISSDPKNFLRGQKNENHF